ncbi:intraflagellar transport protein 57 homolog isoform X2 [Artemia franciscana]
MFLRVFQHLIEAISGSIIELDDDPNISAMQVIENFKTLGFQMEITPRKILPGWGSAVEEILMIILKSLLVSAMESGSQNLSWPENNIEIEDMASDADEDDYDTENKLIASIKTEDSSGYSKIAREKWLLEVEKATPRLINFFKQPKINDWRNRLAAINRCQDKLKGSSTDLAVALEKFSGRLISNIDRIESRQKYLNNQLLSFVREYQSCQDELHAAKKKFKEVGGGVTSRNENIKKLDGEIAKLKQQLDERGQAVTDGGSVIIAQKALQRLTNDLINLTVRLGAAQHLYIQGKLKDAQKK